MIHTNEMKMLWLKIKKEFGFPWTQIIKLKHESKPSDPAKLTFSNNIYRIKAKLELLLLDFETHLTVWTKKARLIQYWLYFITLGCIKNGPNVWIGYSWNDDIMHSSLKAGRMLKVIDTFVFVRSSLFSFWWPATTSHRYMTRRLQAKYLFPRCYPGDMYQKRNRTGVMKTRCQPVSSSLPFLCSPSQAF